MSAPQASVILPVYNCERYVEEALQSISAQTFQDFEVLVLNDGSTDRSREIAEAHAKRDTRFRVFSWPNRGQVPTRNDGIALTRGQIIFCMDADDISRPQRFEKQMKHLHEHPECVAVGTRALLIDPDGRKISETKNELLHNEINQSLLFGLGAIRGMCHPTVAMRRQAVLDVGGYCPQYQFAQDIDLFLRLSELGSISNLSDILFEYRLHLNAIGFQKRNDQVRLARKAVDAARLRRGLPSLDEEPTPNYAPRTPADTHRKWAWWALMAGNVATARKHTFKAVVQDPLSRDNLKLAACSIRGH
jgi:glycosyltransferase involved in cell wall biosynthesis